MTTAGSVKYEKRRGRGYLTLNRSSALNAIQSWMASTMQDILRNNVGGRPRSAGS